MGRPASNETERFLAKVQPKASGCHEWQAGIDRGGYGKVYFRGTCSVLAHRAAYELFVSPITNGLSVLHRCDNRKCVNPEHLFLGTASDNIADMDAKGRRGSKCSLTVEDAKQIKVLLSARFSQEKISKRFGVSQTAISRLKLGKTILFKENS